MAIQHTPTLQLPYPESTDTANVPRDIKALADAMDPLGVAPVGAMFMWPAASAPADVDGTGRALWLLMLGQALPAATYPKLATLLGSLGGNVTIPDMRDTFPVGAGPTMALGGTGGAPSVILAKAHMPIHDHSVSTAGRTGAADRSLRALSEGSVQDASGGSVALALLQGAKTGFAYNTYGNAPYASSDGAFPYNHVHFVPGVDHYHVINAEGAGTAHENRPPYRAVNFIIRAG